jgi:hypothetical protein
MGEILEKIDQMEIESMPHWLHERELNLEAIEADLIAFAHWLLSEESDNNAE